MKCKNCPALIDNSNESNGHEKHCWYGDSYEDEYGVEFKDGELGCRKQRKDIEKDINFAKDCISLIL